ncbi:MAG TPA: hypothetical protein VFZ61_04280 [Polyangiales bacterium]
MPLNRTLLVLLVGLSLLHVACDERGATAGGSESPSAVADAASEQRIGNSRGPIASTLSGPARVAQGHVAELLLSIDRRALPHLVPVEVQLLLPPEVALERGAEHTRVAPSDEPHAQLRFLVRPLARTRTPLTVVIDAHGDGFGYHAELPFYFEGQAQPRSAPARTAGAVRVGRRNFGQAVSIEPASD